MADYKPDRQGTGRLLRSSEMARVVLAAAEIGADAARAAAPDAPPYGTGLKDSIRVEYEGDRGGVRQDRVEATIVADTDYAAYVQFGTSRMKANPFLQAAIDAIEGSK